MHAIKVGASGYGNVVAEAKREDGFKSKVGTIDETKTKNNYGLLDRPAPKNIDEHIKSLGVKRKIRADAVRMCSVIVDYPRDEIRAEREFFDNILNGLKKCLKIDDKALLYAEVHTDEGHKHMHVGFVPLVEKKKRYKDGHEELQVKLSAKDVLTKEVLEELHPFMQRYMEERGFTGTLLHEDGVKRDKDFLEHKITKLEEERVKLVKEVEELGVKHDVLHMKVSDKQEQLDFLDQESERLNTKINDMETYVNDMKAYVNGFLKDIQVIEDYRDRIDEQMRRFDNINQIIDKLENKALAAQLREQTDTLSSRYGITARKVDNDILDFNRRAVNATNKPIVKQPVSPIQKPALKKQMKKINPDAR